MVGVAAKRHVVRWPTSPTVGVRIEGISSGNTIGGSAAGDANVISSNASDGVEISGSSATANVVAGNLIGTNSTGTNALPNNVGVEIDGGATGNLVGTNGDGVDDALERNILSGNLYAGVWMTGAGTDYNVVAGNYIGTDVTGTIAVGNGSTDELITSGLDNAGIGGGVEIQMWPLPPTIWSARPAMRCRRRAGHAATSSPGSNNDGVDIFGSGTAGTVVVGRQLRRHESAAGTAALGNVERRGVFITQSLALPTGSA